VSRARAARASLTRFVDGYPSVPVRRAVARGRARWVRLLPGSVRRRFELDGEIVDPLRVEIGAGGHPTPGYVHVDANRRSRHLEHVARAGSLPFGDGTVEEILAVHILEHVHPTRVDATLREWRRVLRPGGFAQIHVPNAATVFPAFLNASADQKWMLMVGIFGDTAVPGIDDEATLDVDRHQAVYDFGLLEHVLLAAGFDKVEDFSTEITDRHTAGWSDVGLVDRISLVVRATVAPEV
jgi:SAM-dependent methyltransferase